MVIISEIMNMFVATL